MAKPRAKAAGDERPMITTGDNAGTDAAWIATIAAEHDLIAAERRAERRFVKASNRYAEAEANLVSHRTRLNAAREALRERQAARESGPTT